MLPGPGDVHLRPKPGAFMEYFAGKLVASRSSGPRSDEPPAEHPEWYDRDARLQVMDAQGVEATWLFPSQGVVVEAPILHHDIDAAIGVLPGLQPLDRRAVGLRLRGSHLRRAVPEPVGSRRSSSSELAWCLDHGARVVAIRHGAAVTADGLRSPADPMFDRFWGLAQESGVVVSSHDGSDSTYAEHGPAARPRCGVTQPTLGADASGGQHADDRWRFGHRGAHEEPDRPRLRLHPRGPPAVRAVPTAEGRLHRERLRVGAVAAPGARVPGPRWRLPAQPAGSVHRALLGRAVRRGERRRARPAPPGRADPVRLRLAPRRGLRGARGTSSTTWPTSRSTTSAGSCTRTRTS